MKLKALIIAGAMVASVSAFAADGDSSIKPYAKVITLSVVNTSTPAVGDSTTKVYNVLSGVSRFGLDGKQGDVTYKVEAGVKGSDASNTVYLRQAFAKWNFGMGNLLVGQTFTPYWGFPNTIADGMFSKAVSDYDDRQMQVKVCVKGGYLALMANSNTATESTPKAALGYKADIMTGLNLNVGFAYQPGDTSDDVAWLAYVKASLKGKIYGNFNASYGVNTGNMGLKYTNVALASTKGKDSAVMNLGVKAGYKVSKTIKAELGATYQSGDTGVAGSKADTDMQIYANVPVTLAKGFTAMPTFLYQDKMKDSTDTDEGTEMYYGVAFVAMIK